MLLRELIQQILRDMWAHKLRSTLALFGIVWGTVAVVVLLALGQGFYDRQMQNLASLAKGTLEVYLGKTSKPYKGLSLGRQLAIKANAIANLIRDLPDIAYASPVLMNSGYLAHADERFNRTVYGVASEYILLRHWQPISGGRFINGFDIKTNRRVVFLGAKLKTSLFPHEEALHQQILINGLPFTIIGVREIKDQSESWEDYNAFIPYTTFTGLWGDQNLDLFIVSAKDPEQVSQAKATLIHYLARRYYFDPSDPVLNINDYSSISAFVASFFRAIQGFLGICGALTLGVGGIGIANTLFLIVRERTQEIGLRKAMGAQNYHILGQILLETLLLVGFGGLIGMIISVLIIQLLGWVQLPDWLGRPVLSLPILVATCLILMTIGLIAGYYPARRAARFQPVEALGVPPC